MVTITLGSEEITLSRPDDLAERVFASTGLSMQEASRILLVAAPAMLARAVMPLLPDDSEIDPASLGWFLVGAEVTAIIAAIRPFFEEPVHEGE